MERDATASAAREFVSHWKSVPQRLPQRSNVVRLQTNEGTWHVSPEGDGSSRVSYRFAIDPGGWIPSFAADYGNRVGVVDTFNAIEKEAARRAPRVQAMTKRP
jgi:hypothetical protein